MGVSWDDAQPFCQWIGAQLPSVAEGAYTTRSQGRNTTYPWGAAGPDCDRLNLSGCEDDDGAGTSIVCTHQAGDSAQSIHDLAGVCGHEPKTTIMAHGKVPVGMIPLF